MISQKPIRIQSRTNTVKLRQKGQRTVICFDIEVGHLNKAQQKKALPVMLVAVREALQTLECEPSSGMGLVIASIIDAHIRWELAAANFISQLKQGK